METLIRWLGTILSAIGGIACLAALVATWYYYPRFTQKTEEVYVQLDEALVVARQQVVRIQELVRQFNEMTSGYQQELKQWAIAEKNDPTKLGHRAEILAGRVEQVSDGMSFVKDLLGSIRKAKRIAHPFRKSNETSGLDQLLEILDALTERVSQASEILNEIKIGNAPEAEKELEQMINQTLTEIVQVLELLAVADDRLQELAESVDEVQQGSAVLKNDITLNLWWGRFAATFVFPWLALGQLALGYCAWNYGKS